MNLLYQVVTQSSRVEKDVHRVLDRLTPTQRNSLEQTLKDNPKGTAATHWKIKKVKRGAWQCDLPDGYRMAYTVLDQPAKTVLILFAGNHDDAASFLHRKR